MVSTSITMLLCILVLFSTVNFVIGEEEIVTVLQKARTEAMKNYPKNILINDMTANLDFEPFSISRLDETTQTFSFTASFSFEWTDVHLDLNATESEVDSSPLISYSSKEIWTPIFAVMNSAFGNVFVQMDEHFPILAELNGSITMNIVVGLETMCDVDITRFPFDEQICKVVIEEYIGIFDITIINDSMLTENKGHTEWEVLSVNTSKQNTEPVTHIILFHLRRETSFYVMGIMFPMVLLSFLNSFVFLLPADSGEKISFLVSIFVTYAVFLNFVNNLIPKSDKMPRLALYLVLVQCHSTLCILATLFILNRHHKTDRKQNQVRPDGQVQKSTEDGNDDGTTKSENAIYNIRHRPPVRDKIVSFKSVERVLFLIFFVLAALMIVLFFV